MKSRFPPFAFVELISPYNKKNITRWLEDMNFMFSWQEQYLTSELRSLVRYCSCHSNIKFISSRNRVISSIYLQSYFSSSQYPKRARKSSCCGPFVAEHPKRYQNHFFLSTSKRYDQHPRPFNMRAFPSRAFFLYGSLPAARYIHSLCFRAFSRR